MSNTLVISEIFLSIQGESTRAGLPCAFIRLAGCNLRCSWCDTPYAQAPTSGEEMSLDAIITRTAELQCRRVEVTGGEPLTQPGCIELLRRLCDEGYETLLETNGSLDISPVDDRVIRIMDFKCPSSGQQDHNLLANADCLTQRDEAKFVIADRTDYEYARGIIRDMDMIGRCGAVILSPVASILPPAKLAEWILQDDLDVRLGLQLHKIVWPDRDRGV